MTDFNPFLDLSSKNDEDLLNDLSRIYSMISHYQHIGNGTLVNQLQSFRDTYLNEMAMRGEKKQQVKEEKPDPVVIDTDKSYTDTKHRQIF